MRTIEGHHDFGVLERRVISLIDERKRREAGGPLSPVAIIAPTRHLLAHLQQILAESLGSLLNVHFFHHDSLAREAIAATGAVVPETLSNEVKGAILSHQIQGVGGALAEYAASRPGCVAALVRTMDDLREAGIPADARPPAALSRRGCELLGLYASYSDRLTALSRRGLVDRAALHRVALDRIASFIGEFDLVIHYGAYELIGANLDLMQAIERAGTRLLYLAPFHPTSPAFERARSLYSEALAGSPAAVRDDPDGHRLLGKDLPSLYDEGAAPKSADSSAVRFFHAQGASAELREVALRIVALHRDDGIPLHRVAVVARSLQPYAPLLRNSFAEYRLPFTTTATLTALREARVQAAINLLRVVLGDFERQPLMDLLKSGLFGDNHHSASDAPQAWDRLSREHRAFRGYETWTLHLPAVVERWEPHLPPDADDRSAARAAALGEARSRQARDLGETVRELFNVSRPIARATGWATWAEAVERVCRDHLHGFAATAGGELDPGAQAVLDVLSDMRHLDAVGCRYSPVEAAAHFERALASYAVPIGSRGAQGESLSGDNGGVRVLDAMQARGLAFDSVYFIGLNADLFPRRPHEDPFLDDEDRLLLRQRYRRPLPIQAEARAEERLLLAHILGSARRRLTVSWQRADDAGRARVPSLALREIARLTLGAADLEPVEERAERLEADPGATGRIAIDRYGILPVSEARLGAALQLRSPGHLREAMPYIPPSADDDAETLKRGLEMLSATEEFVPTDLRFDALVGPVAATPEVWSPSRLEALGSCPLSYFFRYVLGVRELEEPAEEYALATPDLGLSVHQVLHDVYRSLLEEGAMAGAEGDLPKILERAERLTREAWDRRTAALASLIRSRYPVLWELTSRTWLAALGEFMRRDLKEIVLAAGEVIGLEEEAGTILESSATGRSVAVRGRFDRVRRTAVGGIVVSDYKTAGDLAHGVDMATLLKGERLQMALYYLMAEPLLVTAAGSAPIRAEVLGVGPRFDAGGAPGAPEHVRAELDQVKFDENREGFLETVSVLVELAESGTFPFNEKSRLCRRCPYRRACRKTHTPSRMRLAASPSTEPYTLLRLKNTRNPTINSTRALAAKGGTK